MKKFIKVALLEEKERLEHQEIQLEETRTNSSSNLFLDLQKFHKVDENHIEIQLEKKRTDSYDEFFENLLDKAGLYSRKNSDENKSLGFMIDSVNKGVDENFIEKQLEKKRFSK